MTALRRALFALVAASAAIACGSRPGSAPPPSRPTAREASPGVVAPEPEPAPAAPLPSARPASTSVILVTLDGVRWQDVFHEQTASLLPRTEQIVERHGLALGRGERCGVVRPRNATNISLPSYLEIFTGHRTTCMSNVCPNVREPTVLDAASAAGISTASIGSWDMLVAAVSNGSAGAFVSAGTAWPGVRPLPEQKLEDLVAEGAKAKPFPAYGGPYRPDRFTAAIAVEYLRARRPRLFHVGLGDADEYAHRDDRAGYTAALVDADAFIAELAEALEALDLFESTAVLIVADHGRANVFREHGPTYPESGRSFVLAFGGHVPHRGDVCASRDVWLTDIAATIRELLGLPPDASPEAAGSAIPELLH